MSSGVDSWKWIRRRLQIRGLTTLSHLNTQNDQLSVNATLDNGSEVNMMSQSIFHQKDLPIDTEILWRINAYNELTATGPIDVCHHVPVNIGGIEIK
jgi:hypothetical protein